MTLKRLAKPLSIFILFFLKCSGENVEDCFGYECLKNYVDKPDSAYTWSNTGYKLEVDDPYNTGSGWTGYYLNFTSQQWLTEKESSWPIWWHTAVIIVPDRLEHTDVAVLWITDGDNDKDLQPGLTNYNLLAAADLAVATGTPCISLFQIPNGPISFPSDPTQKKRVGDDLIAYTWRYFFDDPTSNPEFVLQLPMTKAAVKAMDTAQNFFASESNLGISPEHFIVAGASKRGWVSWLTAAVDPRVMGIAPIVMDELNFIENIMHHWRAYGGWTFALHDYWEKNLTLEFNEPKMVDLAAMMDPFQYKDRLILPKAVCNSAGDEFFMLDNTRYWWNRMPEHQKMNKFLMLPNTEHLTATGIVELLPAASTWAREIMESHDRLSQAYGGKRPIPDSIDSRNAASEELMDVSLMPKFNWTIQPVTGDILVQAETDPLSVHMWHAKTCNTERRDFRLLNADEPCTCGIHIDGLPLGSSCVNLAVLWTATELQETFPGSKTWLAVMDPDIMGRWTAFFVDLQFPGPEHGRGWPIGYDGTFEFTTTVSIVPETFPFEECHGEECLGTIV